VTQRTTEALQLDPANINVSLTPFLRRALPLVHLGIRVFPCEVRGKEPVMLESGKRISPLKHATRFEETIRSQWGGLDFAECNVGCFFPRAAQINFVVDIDSLSACEKILGRPLSLTGVAEVQSSTPDKRHAYFSGKVPDWFWAFNSSYKDASGNDHELFSVRNANRYTVGPGSVHPSGVTYTWLNGEPNELPSVNEPLLRELQAIAELSGNKRPDATLDGDPLSSEQYDRLIEAMRDNFERLSFPDYEERISRRHGGVEFVFHPCPLGDHDEGNNTGLITVAPSGKLGWHCFHSSHTMPWKQFRSEIEHQTGQKFIFPAVPTITIGTKAEGPLEDAKLDFAPDSVPRLEIERTDYIDMLAETVTAGTKLPFNFARETFKMLFLAALPETRPTLTWFHTLHTREYVILVSEKPGDGKGETFRRCQRTVERAVNEYGAPLFDIKFIKGSSLGSPQWACVELGGERESSKRIVNQKKPSINVSISKVSDTNGRIVYYDEGKMLFQHDSVGKGAERGLLTMFTSLFESNEHSMGSFSNGRAEVKNANTSLMLHFTRDGFDRCFTGSGASRDGFLSRCVIVADSPNPTQSEWARVESGVVQDLVNRVQECLRRTEMPEDNNAQAVRRDFTSQYLQTQDPLYSARLQFLFTQDLYARAIFSPEARITADAVERAIAWTKHQMLTRKAMWPPDTSADPRERMYHALVSAFKKHQRLSTTDAMKFGNVRRPGSGGVIVFNQVLNSMKVSGEIAEAGKNRKGRPLWQWVGE
jgi:hypothetical protein